ncbi:MAG: hypothetical protein Kow0098_22490 [Ignavibacteriaceae bacterium]
MGKNKVSFYFVLYLVVLVELLAVIIERDNNESELKARIKEYETIQDSVIALYSKPISLHVQENTDWLITGRDSLHILVTVSNLQTDEEKSGVEYFVTPVRTNAVNPSVYNIVTNKETGDGDFYFRTLNGGKFRFSVYCRVNRQFPKYLPDIIMEGITSKIGNKILVHSDTVYFNINAKRPNLNFDRPGRG